MSNLKQSKEDLDAVTHWRGKHVQAIRERDALQQLLNAADERRGLLEGLLRTARQFVVNGIDLGYIQMPDADTPDPAHDLVPKIDAALNPAEGNCRHGHASVLECPECGAPYQ